MAKIISMDGKVLDDGVKRPDINVFLMKSCLIAFNQLPNTPITLPEGETDTYKIASALEQYLKMIENGK